MNKTEIINQFGGILHAFIYIVLAWAILRLGWWMFKKTVKMFWWIAVAILVLAALTLIQ